MQDPHRLTTSCSIRVRSCHRREDSPCRRARGRRSCEGKESRVPLCLCPWHQLVNNPCLRCDTPGTPLSTLCLNEGTGILMPVHISFRDLNSPLIQCVRERLTLQEQWQEVERKGEEPLTNTVVIGRHFRGSVTETVIIRSNPSSASDFSASPNSSPQIHTS